MFKNNPKLLRLIELMAFLIAFMIISSNLMNVLIIKGHSTESRMYDVYEGYAHNTDVLFVGSSHAGQLVGRNLWRDYGVSSYTIAGNSQPVDVMYHSVVEFLRYEKPKVIAVETALIPDDNMEEPDTQYEGRIQNDASFRYSLNYLKMASEQIRNFKLPFKEDGVQLLYKWPLMHDRYKDLVKDDLVIDMPYLNSDTDPIYSVPEEEAQIVTSNERAPISSIGDEYLRKLIALCQKENIPLVLFHTPYPAPEISLAQQNTISDIAAENNVPFIDFNYLVDEIGFDVQTDQAKDLNHVNYQGAGKITDYLGRYLIENYGLEDHREDPAYDNWNKDLDAWDDIQVTKELMEAPDIPTWSELFGNEYKNYVVIITLSGDYTSVQGGTVQDILGRVSAPEGFYEKGGTLVLDHGNVLFYSGDEATYVFTHKFENAIVSADRLMSNEEYMAQSDSDSRNDGIYIWCDNYIRTNNGLNVTIYNSSLDIVIDSIGIETGDENAVLIREEDE